MCFVRLFSILVGAALYVAIGMIVNWKVKHVETVPEMVPHREFWCAVPGLVTDGVKFIFHGCKKGDYVNV